MNVMSFDLKSLRERERKFVEDVKSYESGSKSKSSERTDYKYKLLYPQKGTTTVKFLYNPKSDMFKRQVFKHNLGEKNKVVCLRTWGMPCEIDPILRKIETVKGVKPPSWAYSGGGKGISLVEFVHADYPIQDISPGDIVLFMYPWTIFKDLGLIVEQAKTEEDFNKLIATNNGYLIDVYRSEDNNYSAKARPFETHKTFNLHEQGEPDNPAKVAEEERKFHELLTNLDALTTLVDAPEEPDESIYKAIKGAKEYLYNHYLKDNSVDRINDPATQESSTLSNMSPDEEIREEDVPEFSSQSSQTETRSPSNGKPECFGKFGSVSFDDACLPCPHEEECRVQTEKMA